MDELVSVIYQAISIAFTELNMVKEEDDLVIPISRWFNFFGEKGLKIKNEKK